MKKRIYNPITKTHYEIEVREVKAGGGLIEKWKQGCPRCSSDGRVWCSLCGGVDK